MLEKFFGSKPSSSEVLPTSDSPLGDASDFAEPMKQSRLSNVLAFKNRVVEGVRQILPLLPLISVAVGVQV